MFRLNQHSRGAGIVLAALMILSVSALAAEDGHSHKNPKMQFPDATMEKAYQAEALYTCPMHSEVISDDVELECPICGMDLKQMVEEKVVELRSQELFGCPMCAIVRSGEAVEEGCTVCGMNLLAIPHNCESLHDNHDETSLMKVGEGACCGPKGDACCSKKIVRAEEHDSDWYNL
ncbi:hypothetical protein H8E52_07105 [bacterium]|nr:hypothetical protein [bacterium]